MHALISLRCWCNIQIFCISIRLQCWLNTVHLALFLGSISPHVNCFFHTASDEKLGRAWERGYYSSFTYMWIAYKLYSHANSANWGTWIRLVYNIYQNTSCKWRARLHTYIHTHPHTWGIADVLRALVIFPCSRVIAETFSRSTRSLFPPPPPVRQETVLESTLLVEQLEFQNFRYTDYRYSLVSGLPVSYCSCGEN